MECVDNNFDHTGECSGLKVCVRSDTTLSDLVKKYLPVRSVVPGGQEWNIHWKNVYSGLVEGHCNVIIEEDSILAKPVMERELGVNGSMMSPENFAWGQNYYALETYSIMTSSKDPQFTDFTNAIIQSLLAAEHHNISQETADIFPQTNLFGEDYKDMFRHAIGMSGNYREIYDRNLLDWLPRSAPNYHNHGNSGLMLSHPLGSIDEERNMSKPVGAALLQILERRQLRCGIRVDRPGFVDHSHNGSQHYSGMDVDFCQSLAAGLYGGDSEAVKFVEIDGQDVSSGYTLLANGDIDVLAGATWTLETDIKEPTTGRGYAFSQPYFYGYSEEEDNLCLATRQDDHDWYTFVYWIVAGTFYAEEHNVTSTNFHDMPEVNVYGPDFTRMFKDSILAMGSYAEIYERNVEPLFPRQGRNLLYLDPHVGPQHYVISGFGL